MSDMPRPVANAEMVEGYMDGLDPNCPCPLGNRSHSYRHGFANGRDDRAQKPRASYNELLRLAEEAEVQDRREAFYVV